MKWRFFRHLTGGDDPEAERVYRWHIERRIAPRTDRGLPMDGWKMSPDDYVSSATKLWQSMCERGFDEKCPIPVDPDGELLAGAHRAACALALNIGYVTVALSRDYAWAPPWDYLWFIKAEMPHEDMFHMLDDWRILTDGSVRRWPKGKNASDG